ncbi:iron-sulfur cluster insertion protein ErpA-like [Tubulanus polymorphus]|uniref:iron-sulfur cluster insertion protein ErpA-like n=1 Tax=Tubulanus polymorphus TaxID=672921 RepID=UPI003DA62DA9
MAAFMRKCGSKISIAKSYMKQVPPSSLWATVINRTESTDAGSENISNGLVLSDNCVAQLKKVTTLKKDSSDNSFLRILVEGGGCSGFQYKFELDKNLTDEDVVFEKDGAKVVVDKESLPFIAGSTIDYHTELIRSAFQIVTNPNADKSCSCGVSFALKL